MLGIRPYTVKSRVLFDGAADGVRSSAPELPQTAERELSWYTSYVRKLLDPSVIRRVFPEALLPRPRPIVAVAPFVHATVTVPVASRLEDALVTTGS